MNNDKIITVFGGTGFIGRHIVRRLARAEYTVKIATRYPESAYFLRPYGKVGQIVPFACDYDDDASIAAAVSGATAVVNCIGILFEKRRQTFEKIHVGLAQQIAQASARAGVGRLIHFSALGTTGSKSRYARSKKAGEDAVRAAFPAATILRPSVVFGPEDEFFNKFARLSGFLPALPLIGGGKTKFQPVYVGDVAAAAMAALTLPAIGDADPCGKTYELGGPETVSFRGALKLLAAHTWRRRLLVPVPWGIAKLKGAVLGLLPRPMLTRDQVETLKTDSVVAAGASTLRDLGITPTGMGLILPDYLAHYRRGGAFAEKKRA